MTLLRLTIGWMLVAAWFIGYDIIEQGITRTSPADRRLRAPVSLYVADALVFTLFAALWFASLGAGGWLLLFGLVGIMLEGPSRYRDQARGMDWGRPGVMKLVSGVLRVVIAGGILAWRF